MNDTLCSKAITNTPVFSKENFADYFGEGTEGGLILDEWDQIDPVETIIFPESIFQVRNTIQKRTHTVFEVITKEYPSATPLYIDSRFVQVFRNSEPPKERVVQLPSQDTVIKKLREQIGKQYVWGGNSPNGIELLATYFPSKVPLDTRTHAKWILDGFDCSGLLYWATNGYTPRNTSGLVDFGVGVDIAKKTRDEIMRILKPLDSIVWKGHTLVVIDEDEVIESTVNFAPAGKFTTPNGVRVRKMSEVLRAIQDEKRRLRGIAWMNLFQRGWSDMSGEGGGVSSGGISAKCELLANFSTPRSLGLCHGSLQYSKIYPNEYRKLYSLGYNFEFHNFSETLDFVDALK